MIENRKIFTVGHSNHTIEYFLELLESQSISCLIDVRSVPASKFSPQYNKEPLEKKLKKYGITYMNFKHEFGARQEDEGVLDENRQVNFESFRKTFRFQQGVERVDIGISKGFKIALVCAEGDPLECHRFSMISSYLEEIGIQVDHILKDKSVKTHKQLEATLLEKYSKKLPEATLFEPNVDEKQKLKAAYKLHNKDIGWMVQKQPQRAGELL